MVLPKPVLPSLFALLALSTLPLPAIAIGYTESINGELSSNRNAPTLWGTLQTGSNLLIGTTDVSDLDYFTINIPAGHQFSGLKMVAYDSGSSGDETAFIGLQAGTVMTVPPTTQSAEGLLGWSHFGPGAGNVGQDILPHLGVNGFGATGFVPPLPANNYTFWIQQNGAFDPVSFTFEFIVTGPPAGIAGDYNNDGHVDAADYVLWRNGGPLANEVDAPGTVNDVDYTEWRSRFGNPTSGGGLSAAVPEPSTLLLSLVALLVAWGSAGGR